MTTWRASGDCGKHYREITNEDETRIICQVWTKWNVFSTHHQHHLEPCPEGEADFRLILAAPQMLEALEKIAALKYPPWGDANDILKIFHQCNAIARAAIAVVKGDSR